MAGSEIHPKRLLCRRAADSFGAEQGDRRLLLRWTRTPGGTHIGSLKHNLLFRDCSLTCKARAYSIDLTGSI